MSALAEPASLPSTREAGAPPEARGLARDAVRLLVASIPGGALRHARFDELPRLLAPGDLVVINISATLPAALSARRAGGTSATLHLSTPVPGEEDGGAPALQHSNPAPRKHTEGARWVVELRRGDEPLRDARAGERLALPADAAARLEARYLGTRLWVASLSLPEPLPAYLAHHGRPIRYRHVEAEWPLSAYQTAYATEPGSAEMPSAGRPFTTELITELVTRGIDVAPVVLHTGVSSLELGERPYPERFRVPASTAKRVNLSRAGGGRVVAVGTTVVRALESAADEDGRVRAAGGWTDLVVEPRRGIRAVDGLLTGFHDPDASHLQLLEALAGSAALERCYRSAARAGYLSHEFGDLALFIPDWPLSGIEDDVGP
ncbi:MAG: S-adenosylmethionine:tRNA ribosyltransferase-isomerase [Solirubrobacteraceae bacterium]